MQEFYVAVSTFRDFFITILEGFLECRFGIGYRY